MRMNFEKKAGCLVTGVAGFVGSHLAEQLLALGHSVVGIDNFASGRKENMASFLDHTGFTFYERSVTQSGLLKEIKEKHPNLRICFHLAAIVSVPFSVDHPELTMEVNHGATLNLLGEAEELDLDRFIFAGSAAEYGNDQRLPLLEEYAMERTVHLSPYGKSKYLASKAVSSRSCGIALRFFNIYGPRQDPSSPYSGVISRFIDRGLSGKPLTIFGDGRHTRDFVYVADGVEAYIRASGLKGSPLSVPPGIYNIGTGKSTAIGDLAEMIKELSENRESLIFSHERPGDICHSIASVESFCKAADWYPSVSLWEGLKKTVDWEARRKEK